MPPDPGTRGRWEYRRGRGWGTLYHDDRPLAKDDFDTSPSQQFITELWDWVCKTLNGEDAGGGPLGDHWRWSNGYLCCGSLRVASLPLGITVEDLLPEDVKALQDAVSTLSVASARKRPMLEPGGFEM